MPKTTYAGVEYPTAHEARNAEAMDPDNVDPFGEVFNSDGEFDPNPYGDDTDED